MACPFFMPVEKLENGAWPHPARLPLGGGWSGRCTAPGHEGEIPTQSALEEFCNLGYAARCGRLRDASRIATIDRRLARLARFRAGLERAFPLPWQGSRLSDDTILCRCEAIRVAQVKAAIRAFDVVEMNRMKAITRVGMGKRAADERA